VLSALIGPPTS